MTVDVREARMADIPLITEYWMSSPPDFLEGMGVDLKKMPSREAFTLMLKRQFNLPLQRKRAYALIWELDGSPIGHTNVNDIIFGQEAKMHLHIWELGERKKGLGSMFVKKSLPYYFNNLQLEKLVCEPFALNPAPNKTLQKVGFDFVKKYRTIPGSINFEQEVNQWVLTREGFDKGEFV